MDLTPEKLILKPLLYLTYEESLRLRKTLDRLAVFLAEPAASALQLHVLRKRLSDLTHSLSPLSATRRLLDELLTLTADHLLSYQNKEQLHAIIQELRDIYERHEQDSI